MFAGDGLVAQPNKVCPTFENLRKQYACAHFALIVFYSVSFNFSQVQKIDIGYAKTAKKMDVKRLKTAMWGILTQGSLEDKVCLTFQLFTRLLTDIQSPCRCRTCFRFTVD